MPCWLEFYFPPRITPSVLQMVAARSWAEIRGLFRRDLVSANSDNEMADCLAKNDRLRLRLWSRFIRFLSLAHLHSIASVSPGCFNT